jgi:hypothetical protein
LSRGQYTSKRRDCGLQTLWFVILSEVARIAVILSAAKDLRLSVLACHLKRSEGSPHFDRLSHKLNPTHRDKTAMNGAPGVCSEFPDSRSAM